MHPSRSIRRAAACLLLVAAFASPALAHDPGLSSVAVKIDADRVEAVAAFAPADIKRLLAPEADAILTQGQLLRLAPDVLRFTAGGRPLRSTSTTVDVDPQSNNVNFRFTFPA
ncbi:MAG: hypothetical protein PHC88_11990, partial [Terrimicrobiaceae bacterium]|nr:hypothetical protein [Terrimicrobiaceae bacterium]